MIYNISFSFLQLSPELGMWASSQVLCLHPALEGSVKEDFIQQTLEGLLCASYRAVCIIF